MPLLENVYIQLHMVTMEVIIEGAFVMDYKMCLQFFDPFPFTKWGNITKYDLVA